MEKNHAILLKSDCVKNEGGKLLLVLYYYHSETYEKDGRRHTVKENTFYKCVVRNEYPEFWRIWAKHFKENNPAERFNLKDFGLKDDFILEGRNIFTRYTFGRWLEMKTSGNKIHTLDEFLGGHRYKNKKWGRKHSKGAFTTGKPYVRNYEHQGRAYDLATPYDFPSGTWLEGLWIPPPRKKPRIIKD